MKYFGGASVLLFSIIASSTVFQSSHCAHPISAVLSSAFAQYIDKISLLKRSDILSSDFLKVESREPPADGGYGGGYGGGGSNGGGKGYGGGYDSGGNAHGAITLDPVSIISLLALGAFLINNILQLLRANAAPTATGRRIIDLDIKVPLDFPNSAALQGKVNYGHNEKRSSSFNYDDGEPSFSQFFENVGSLYYLHPKKRNICIKKVVCGYMNAQQTRENNQGNLKTRIFDLMLSTITRFVAPEITEDAKPDFCHKFNKLCSDSLLHDAKVSTENKVYGHVTSFISNFAMSNFMAG